MAGGVLIWGIVIMKHGRDGFRYLVFLVCIRFAGFGVLIGLEFRDVVHDNL